jgi:hypothetical protein
MLPPKGLRLEALAGEKADPDPKALSGYGLLRADTEKVWMRFVAGQARLGGDDAVSGLGL